MPVSVHKTTAVPVAVVLTAPRAPSIAAAAILRRFYVPGVAQIQFAQEDLEHGALRSDARLTREPRSLREHPKFMLCLLWLPEKCSGAARTGGDS